MRWVRRGGVLAATLLALHGAIWAYAVRRVETEAETWLDGLRRAGWAIASDAPRRGGWPTGASVSFAHLSMDGRAAGVPLAWAADEVSLGIHAAHPDALLITARGEQRWRLGHGPEVPVTATALQLAVTQSSAALSGRGVTVRLPGGPVEVGALQVEGAGQSARGTLTAVKAPSLPTANLSISEAVLTQPVAFNGDAEAAAAAWREAGGTLEVRGLVLEAGSLAVAASGTGRLDASLQPALDLTAQARGHRAALDDLVQAGFVPASAAVAAKAVLNLLTPRPDAPAVVPVRIADGALSVAGFPLLRVPGVNWAALNDR